MIFILIQTRKISATDCAIFIKFAPALIMRLTVYHDEKQQ